MNLGYKNLPFFLFFFALTSILYSGTIYSKFVFDFVDWFFIYQELGWRGLGRSFNDPSLHYVYHFFFFMAVKFLGTNDLAWYFLFCSLHSINAFLLFVVLKKWLHKTQIEYSVEVSIFAALFFLASPYQTEVVVWGATIHYLLVAFFTLLILYLSLLYADIPKQKYLAVVYMLFFIGLFTHEIIMVLPFISIVILFVSHRQKIVTLLLKLALPQLALVAIYFLLNKIVLGKWVAHYGASTHLHFDFWQLQTAFAKYLCKYLLLAQFLPWNAKNFIYTTIENYHWWVGSSLLFALFFLAISWYKNNIPAKSLAALYFVSFAALFPVLNLYFPSWINIHGDRLGYFASLFLYSFLSLLVFSLFRKFAFVLVCMLLLSKIYVLHQNTNNWKQAGVLMNSLEKNFPIDTSKHYYLLNLPDNYNGAYMFRCLGESKFAQRFKLKKNVDRTSQITEVLSYNLQQPDDSVIVTVVDSLKLRVELSHSGNWWWRYTEGATDYEDENVKVDVDEFNHFYFVEFKRKNEKDLFLYQAGGLWNDVKNF